MEWSSAEGRVSEGPQKGAHVDKSKESLLLSMPVCVGGRIGLGMERENREERHHLGDLVDDGSALEVRVLAGQVV